MELFPSPDGRRLKPRLQRTESRKGRSLRVVASGEDLASSWCADLRLEGNCSEAECQARLGIGVAAGEASRGLPGLSRRRRACSVEALGVYQHLGSRTSTWYDRLT